MITTGVAALMAAIGLFMIVKGSVRFTTTEDNRRARVPEEVEHEVPIRIFGFLLIFAAFIVLAFASTYKVATGDAVIKTSPAGAYESVDASTGYHVKAPWTRTVTWDLRNNQVEFGDGEDMDGSLIRTTTSDPVDAWFGMTVTYDLDPMGGGLKTAYEQYRSQETLEDAQIVPAFASKAKEAPTDYPATRIRSERAELSTAITRDMNDRLSRFGVRVSTVDLQEIGLPKGVLDNFNKVQAAASAAEAKRSELVAAEYDAEKARVKAKGQADADQIVRCGATTNVVTEDVNGKPTKITRVVPNATCDPNRLNASVLAARYIDMLEARQGDTTIVLPDNVTPLLNMGAPANAR